MRIVTQVGLAHLLISSAWFWIKHFVICVSMMYCRMASHRCTWPHRKTTQRWLSISWQTVPTRLCRQRSA